VCTITCERQPHEHTRRADRQEGRGRCLDVCVRQELSGRVSSVAGLPRGLRAGSSLQDPIAIAWTTKTPFTHARDSVHSQNE
jgi:hypothetical protein